ncbi:hypothetical protein C8R43DRAFT_1244173, partial [Mycena crocata]
MHTRTSVVLFARFPPALHIVALALAATMHAHTIGLSDTCARRLRLLVFMVATMLWPTVTSSSRLSGALATSDGDRLNRCLELIVPDLQSYPVAARCFWWQRLCYGPLASLSLLIACALPASHCVLWTASHGDRTRLDLINAGLQSCRVGCGHGCPIFRWQRLCCDLSQLSALTRPAPYPFSLLFFIFFVAAFVLSLFGHLYACACPAHACFLFGRACARTSRIPGRILLDRSLHILRLMFLVFCPAFHYASLHADASIASAMRAASSPIAP